jgi:hypothetical protein
MVSAEASPSRKRPKRGCGALLQQVHQPIGVFEVVGQVEVPGQLTAGTAGYFDVGTSEPQQVLDPVALPGGQRLVVEYRFGDACQAAVRTCLQAGCQPLVLGTALFRRG